LDGDGEMNQNPLTPEEKSILITSIKKHRPELILKVDQLDSGTLDYETIDDMSNALVIELASDGIDADSQINDYGFKLENLIDRIADLYLWPMEKKKYNLP
jgi:hypothetical protein